MVALIPIDSLCSGCAYKYDRLHLHLHTHKIFAYVNSFGINIIILFAQLSILFGSLELIGYGVATHEMKLFHLWRWHYISKSTIGAYIHSKSNAHHFLIHFLIIFKPCKDKGDPNSSNRIKDEAASCKPVDIEQKSCKRSMSSLENLVLQCGNKIRTPKTFGHAYIAFM